jgi:hypothetical protein
MARYDGRRPFGLCRDLLSRTPPELMGFDPGAAGATRRGRASTAGVIRCHLPLREIGRSTGSVLCRDFRSPRTRCPICRPERQGSSRQPSRGLGHCSGSVRGNRSARSIRELRRGNVGTLEYGRQGRRRVAFEVRSHPDELGQEQRSLRRKLGSWQESDRQRVRMPNDWCVHLLQAL